MCAIFFGDSRPKLLSFWRSFEWWSYQMERKKTDKKTGKKAFLVKAKFFKTGTKKQGKYKLNKIVYKKFWWHRSSWRFDPGRSKNRKDIQKRDKKTGKIQIK